MARFRLPRMSLSTVGIGVLALVLAAGLSLLLIQVMRVSEENDQLENSAESLAQQVEDMGGQPVIRPEDLRQGPRGEQGDRGPRGPRGPEGDRGPRGPAGERGPIGPQGSQGDTGSEGERGPQGEAGSEGDQGPQGEQGPAGPQGETGPQGPPGADGRTPAEMTCTRTEPLGDTYECSVTGYAERGGQ